MLVFSHKERLVLFVVSWFDELVDDLRVLVSQQGTMEGPSREEKVHGKWLNGYYVDDLLYQGINGEQVVSPSTGIALKCSSSSRARSTAEIENDGNRKEIYVYNQFARAKKRAIRTFEKEDLGGGPEYTFHFVVMCNMDDLDLCSLITSQLPRSLFSICKKLVVLELSKNIVLDVPGFVWIKGPSSKFKIPIQSLSQKEIKDIEVNGQFFNVLAFFFLKLPYFTQSPPCPPSSSHLAFCKAMSKVLVWS
ncbi:hypothetical protein NC653_033662 [Populus alba x Populus x berolinensis]|uniref:Uncharacterized protein n=2 Tax=Populus TaxID=3689 RepID=A0A4U5R502_POPAL|nr:hypothetical protein NC653_033662 [Populus alba x Populus x berolinensis]TKS18431.1 hypothetical protein D5086_0000001000 [Populus alba]